MKRFVCLFLALILMPIVCLADLPDISNLSHDELIELSHQISLLLFSQQLVNGVEVPAGVYTVGVDIPAGIYRLELVHRDATSMISVTHDDDYGFSSLFGEDWSVFEVGKVEFFDGDEIEIIYSPLRFLPYTGLFR